MPSQEIWIVDDDDSIRWVLQRALAGPGRLVRCFSRGGEALQAANQSLPDVVLTDLRMPGLDGIELLSHLNQLAPDLPVILMTAYSDLSTTVAAYSHGAHEYLPKPFDIDEASRLVARALQRRKPGDGLGGLAQPDELCGESAVMQQVFRHIGRLSRSHLGVLIVGETGTGKELAARALHHHSQRAKQPFVALNMAAVPSDLLEAELFGHERGAFTGAQQRHLGRFEQAHGGTLFLDEIGDLPLPLQTRLLRVLAEGEFYRIGGRALIAVDVRVIAATHQDLSKQVAAGAFRQDLYHRLNVVQVLMPPLRERGDDVLLLARRFLQQAATDTGLEARWLDDQAEPSLLAYPWPGNVRELENLCRRLTVMAPGTLIQSGEVEAELFVFPSTAVLAWEDAFAAWFERQLATETAQPMASALERVYRLMLLAALEKTAGGRAAAARLLGCGRNTLTRQLRKLGLDQPG